MSSREDVLEQLVEHLEACSGAVAVVLDDDEGVMTYLYDAETDEEPELAKTTLLTAAGQDFLENLELWALQEAARRGDSDADDVPPLGPDGSSSVDADAGDPESPEFQ